MAFSTSLGLVERNGAPVDKFMELLRGSKVYAPTFDKKLPLMLERSYGKANFPTKVRLTTSMERQLPYEEMGGS